MSRTIQAAIARGLRFLLDHQDADGAWRDFLCAPGRAEAWTTAYIGARVLSTAPNAEALPRAAHFLEHAACQGGGWGYNRACDPDADSTAQAILFLRRMNSPVAPRSYATLAAFQLADGSFATYRDPNVYGGWATGHPDVTAVALQALAPLLADDHTILRRGLDSLRHHLVTPHAHASYWWPSRFYLPLELLRLRAVLPSAPVLDATSPSASLDSFDAALALECNIISGNHKDASAYAEELLRAQLQDGSWPAQPILRIASRDALSVAQAAALSAPLITDDRRLFTTATVLQALTAAAAPAS